MYIQRLQKIAATKIQKIWKGHLARKAYKEFLQKKAEAQSSMIIQNVWRKQKAKEELQK